MNPGGCPDALYRGGAAGSKKVVSIETCFNFTNSSLAYKQVPHVNTGGQNHQNQYNLQSTFCINFALPMPTLPCQFSNKIRSIYSSRLLGVPTCFVLTYPMISLGPLAKKQPRVQYLSEPKKYGSILKPVTTSVQRHDDSAAHRSSFNVQVLEFW